ncbi:MAG: hypothetical protein ABI402_15815 [Ferruginibacter sp.]
MANRGLANNFIEKDCRSILKELKKVSLDGVRNLSGFYVHYFDHIISEQLLAGAVRIYDIDNHSFSISIFHRMERVISNGYRRFYFSKSDRRYLFSALEWTGIIPNEFMETE